MTDKNPTHSEKKCPFCRIIRAESPAKIVYQDDQCMAFWDLYPKAKIHILIIPLKHISSINEMTAEDEPIIGHLAHVAAKIAKDMGITSDTGYRLVTNTGPGAGQSVAHIHVHFLSGKPFTGL